MATILNGMVISMRFEYDSVRDLLYIRFARVGDRAARTETIIPGVHADFDVAGKLMGIEVIDATELMGSTIEFELPEMLAKTAARGC